MKEYKTVNVNSKYCFNRAYSEILVIMASLFYTKKTTVQILFMVKFMFSDRSICCSSIKLLESCSLCWKAHFLDFQVARLVVYTGYKSEGRCLSVFCCSGAEIERTKGRSGKVRDNCKRRGSTIFRAEIVRRADERARLTE